MNTRNLLFISILFTLSFILGGCSGNSSTGKNGNMEDIHNKTQSGKRIPLVFSQVETEEAVQVLDESRIKSIVADKKFDDTSVFVYENTEDRENLYGGIKFGDKLYNVGVISMNGIEADLISINQVELFDRRVVRIDGIFGANYSRSKYLSIDRESPQVLIRVDGNVKELDIDNDGQEEIVSSYGTAASTSIYEWDRNNFSVVNINDILQAAAVIFNSQNKTLTAYYKGNTKEPETFKYSRGSLEVYK